MTNRLARPGEVNGDMFDSFTLKHAAFGALMGFVRVPFWGAVVAAVGWEIVENPLKDSFPQLFPYPTHDRLPNAVGDAMAMVAGWGAVRMVRK